MPLTAAPGITAQPGDRVTVAGNSATFSVAATGTPAVGYQWRFNGTNLPAATASLLLLTNVALSQAGSYSVLITNLVGSTNSGVALLSVYATAAPTLGGAGYIGGGQFQFSLSGVPGYAYAVSGSTNLINWTLLQPTPRHSPLSTPTPPPPAASTGPNICRSSSAKAPGGWRTPGRWRVKDRASVLECGSPLPLSVIEGIHPAPPLHPFAFCLPPPESLHWRDNRILRMKRLSASALALLTFLQLGSQLALAWDFEGHRTVNLLALSSLPTNYPAFVREPAAVERIGFLAGEMDRWRNTTNLSLKQYSFPDHYMDMEELADYGLKAEMLPIFRYDFIGQLAVIRHAHPDKFPEADAASNADHTRGLVGLLPWAVAESTGKLKSGFSYLKAFREGGTPEEIANAQANIIYVMGVMGHLVGDASQPLHTTIHHHGWVGANPNHYTTSRSFHSWIDGGYFHKTGGQDLKAMAAKMRPAQLVTINGRTAKPEEIFQVAVLFLVEQNKQVEPLYQLDKDGKLSGEGDKGLEGKAFLEGQLLKSAQLLGDIWFTAWEQAAPDTFLKASLAKRKKPASATE